MARRRRLNEIPVPRCNHAPHGFVSSPSILDPEFAQAVPHASTHVCFRPVCIEQGHRWVESITGERGVHTTFEERDKARKSS